MDKLIHEWKQFKAKEIYERFKFDNPTQKDIEIMLMSAIDEGFRASKDFKELKRDIQNLIIKLERLDSSSTNSALNSPHNKETPVIEQSVETPRVEDMHNQNKDLMDKDYSITTKNAEVKK